MSEVLLAIASRADVERARREARSLARGHGFSRADCERVALAASELAMNLVRHANHGEMRMRASDEPAGSLVEIATDDSGPGIEDVTKAMTDGFSTSGGLGSGLPGVRRLMDDFEIHSGKSGTQIVARKWARG